MGQDKGSRTPSIMATCPLCGLQIAERQLTNHKNGSRCLAEQERLRAEAEAAGVDYDKAKALGVPQKNSLTGSKSSDNDDISKQGTPQAAVPSARARKIAEKRKKRSYLSDMYRTRMDVKPTPGMRGRWVNDDGRRVQTLLNAGYEFVSKRAVGSDEKHDRNMALGDRTSYPVGRTREGKVLMAYYMEIEEELAQEDDRKLQELNRQKKNAIVQKKDINIPEHLTYGKASVTG